MYIWTLTTPNRDGALQNDIIVHEFTHGITNRLTGGGTGRCLQTLEAGGMGEGSHTLFVHHSTLTTVSYRLVRRYGRVRVVLPLCPRTNKS